MNQYTDTTNGGLLKNYYAEGDSQLADALRKKREKLAQTKLGLVSDEQEAQDGSG